MELMLREQIRGLLTGRYQDVQTTGRLADKLSTSTFGTSRGNLVHLREVFILMQDELEQQSRDAYNQALVAVERRELGKEEAIRIAKEELVQFWAALSALGLERVRTVANRYDPPHPLPADELLAEFQSAADRILRRRNEDALRGYVDEKRILQPRFSWLGSPLAANLIALLSMLVALIALLISLMVARHP